MIGVNSQIESGSQGTGGGSSGNIGIGFSIPSNMVASTARTLIENAKSNPYVGVELVTVSPALAKATGMAAGVEVVTVTKGAPADKAGLQGSSGTQTVDGTPFSTGGDVITAIDGTARAQRRPADHPDPEEEAGRPDLADDLAQRQHEDRDGDARQQLDDWLHLTCDARQPTFSVAPRRLTGMNAPCVFARVRDPLSSRSLPNPARRCLAGGSRRPGHHEGVESIISRLRA